MQLAENPPARWYPPPDDVALVSLRIGLWRMPPVTFYAAAWFGNCFRELVWEKEVQDEIGSPSEEPPPERSP